MAVIVKFVGALRTNAGKSRLILEFKKAPSLRKALETMAEENPKLKTQFDNARAGMLILVNGRETSVLRGLDTELNDGDEIVFVPVVHGG